MKDESFLCHNCGLNVKSLGYTARDHCPKCLYSRHVDINPGDRLETCQGMLIPIAIEKHKKAAYKIIYQCEKCERIRKNIMVEDDNMDLIIALSVNKT